MIRDEDPYGSLHTNSVIPKSVWPMRMPEKETQALCTSSKYPESWLISKDEFKYNGIHQSRRQQKTEMVSWPQNCTGDFSISKTTWAYSTHLLNSCGDWPRRDQLSSFPGIQMIYQQIGAHASTEAFARTPGAHLRLRRGRWAAGSFQIQCCSRSPVRPCLPCTGRR
jgi:hypothetical protein